MKCSSEIVPYFGRSIVVSGGGDECQRALSQCTTVVGEVSSLAQKNGDWKRIKETICKISHNLLDSSYQIDSYKLNILCEAVIPYIRSMKNRTTLSKSRFDQTVHLLRLLSENDAMIGTIHPSQTLLAVEDIIAAIDREGNFWKSEFSTSLKRAVDSEWQPILRDNRRAIHNISGKLALLGLMEIVRPILLIWPLWLVMIEVLGMVKSINEKKGLSPRSFMQLAKTAILAAVLFMLVKVLSLMPGIGYSCLGLAAVGFVASSTDPVLKHMCMFIAPNLAPINQIVGMIGSGSVGDASMSTDLFSLLFTKISGVESSNAARDSTRSHENEANSRVEELSDEDECRDERSDDIPVQIGLRKRK